MFEKFLSFYDLIMIIGYPLVFYFAYKQGIVEGTNITLDKLEEMGILEFDEEDEYYF